MSNIEEGSWNQKINYLKSLKSDQIEAGVQRFTDAITKVREENPAVWTLFSPPDVLEDKEHYLVGLLTAAWVEQCVTGCFYKPRTQRDQIAIENAEYCMFYNTPQLYGRDEVEVLVSQWSKVLQYMEGGKQSSTLLQTAVECGLKGITLPTRIVGISVNVPIELHTKYQRIMFLTGIGIYYLSQAYKEGMQRESSELTI